MCFYENKLDFLENLLNLTCFRSLAHIDNNHSNDTPTNHWPFLSFFFLFPPLMILILIFDNLPHLDKR